MSGGAGHGIDCWGETPLPTGPSASSTLPSPGGDTPMRKDCLCPVHRFCNINKGYHTESKKKKGKYEKVGERIRGNRPI